MIVVLPELSVAPGLVVWAVVTHLTTFDVSNPFDATRVTPEVAWHRALGPVLIVYVVLNSYTMVVGSWALSTSARRMPALDLLDEQNRRQDEEVT